ncbi:hypothetical protein EHQ62_02750 [Leptospira jelokensis]|uniref:Porin n=1 Tax=Leptospira jelokensis TaxID=2484931 RepID=A0A4Z0ZWU6_9LEPT|nr:hypothetical protein EHQ62_02750 [Leptospira jelokensis]
MHFAQTYSDAVRDDDRANRNFGRVIAKERNARLQNDNPLNGFGSETSLITGGRFQSQKGEIDSEKANRYHSEGMITTPTLFSYQTSSGSVGLFLAPRVVLSESRVTNKEVRTIYDTEGTFLLNQEIAKLQFAMEIGRGYNRLDRYGFIFVGMSNFVSMSLFTNSGFRITGIRLNAKPELENWFAPPWTGYLRELYGGRISSENILFWQEFRLFHFVYEDPNHNTNFGIGSGQRVSGRYSYSGIEFSSKPFFETWGFDFALIRLLGESKTSSSPWSESKIATNSHLGFFSIHSQNEKLSFALAGLVAKKDEKDRLDSNSNGYASCFAEPRVLGGYSSFLLYQSLDFVHPPLFRERALSQNPNFENKGIQMFGIQLGWDWNSFLRSDLFLNRADSILGKGTEAILKLSVAAKDFGNLVSQFSVSYTEMDPRKQRVLVTEPFTEREPNKEYLRFYISLGIQF